jgi:hypothetical protein
MPGLIVEETVADLINLPLDEDGFARITSSIAAA